MKIKNTGLKLEKLINKTNQYYLKEKIAVINKKPTPIKVLKIKNQKIVNGFFEKKSTTDYNGLYNGKYLDFDVKSSIKTKINIKNHIPLHQLKHLELIDNHGGISFIILYFINENKFFVVPYKLLKRKKSLNIFDLEKKNLEIKITPNLILDYLNKVDQLWK